MFLKSLTLKGFKSFAETTTLDMEPGITVVVGPNGSGKSNIVDAIGWVLGAQAPSAVRSQKMDDVIFAGTAKRPALGRAEVALTIDNSAGLLPIEFTEVTLTRTLFRTGDSEYAINGVPCRLLDLQELLSDTGVGRQQHVIVSQGQIDAVLNARPEERRLVIEEAAGVLKYRKRKEKAERRLAATEGNLIRLQDLLREVRRQLKPLERQADAARRHGALVAELHALRLHLTGRDIGALRSRLARHAATRSEVEAEERAVRAALGQLDTAVATAEARLAAIGGHDLGDALARFEALRERARGLAAVLAERRRTLERERGAYVDHAVVATLEAEAAQLSGELDDVEAEAGELAPDADALAEAEAALIRERSELEQTWAGAVVPSSSRAAETRGELTALRSAIERTEAEAARVRLRLDGLDQKAGRLAAELDRLHEAQAEAARAEQALVEQLAQAEAAVADAAAQVSEVDTEARTAATEHHRWAARADALALALDEARARAGAQRLAGVTGVLGPLLDLVDIDEGYAAAFEAAAGEALATVVVDGPDAGRRALAELQRNAAAGAVLAANPSVLEAERRGLRDAEPRAEGVAGGEPLRRHVRGARGDVEAVLDRLVGGVVVVPTWQEALDLVLAHPEAADAVVVTRTGDRFGPAGWRLGGAGGLATASDLEEAGQRAAAAAATADDAANLLDEARARLEKARVAVAAIARDLDGNRSIRTAAADARQRVDHDRHDTVAEVEALRAHVADLAERAARDAERVAELEAALPGLEAEEAGALERGRAMGAARARLEERAAAVGTLRTDLGVRAAGLEQRRELLRRRLGEVEARLERHTAERAGAEARRLELDRRGRALNGLDGVVATNLATVEAELTVIHATRRRQSEEARSVSSRLDDIRTQRAARERELDELRERSRRAELAESETTLRLETAVEAVRRDLDAEPAAAEAAPCPPLAEGVSPSARARELERELRLMGPINPLALEEFEALQERHTFLEGQLDDVKSSRRDLAKIIRAVDSEIVSVFAAAYADVAENFERLFDTLFPGGQGRLRLTEPDNLLDTGIDVEARPSGKNVRKLSLLSGGERSLTALAFLFAVFRSRPSPFYVMDEVEAALDDVNLHRFLDLIHEFREEAQLIIVSHQKRTMEAADCLYGVTMQTGGSSRVLSERVTAHA